MTRPHDDDLDHVAREDLADHVLAEAPMTIAATAWALESDLARTPVERLLLILMADRTDGFGVVSFGPARLAAQARLTPRQLAESIAWLVDRGVLEYLPDAADAWEHVLGYEPRGIAFLFFAAWEDRSRLKPRQRHPQLGRIELP